MDVHLPSRMIDWVRHHAIDLMAGLAALIFSSWLMMHTFGYADGQIVLRMHIWSDFWANIPLIRSFSMGSNWPPEYPLFPGERIRYHFLFFFLVGMLERAGLRIDVALNLLSVIGFAGLLLSIYFITKRLFHSRLAGWFGMVMIMCNSSLAWVYAIFGPLSVRTPGDFLSIDRMITLGPYDGSILSAFWKLNIFTNQRHLAFSFLFMFVGIWAIVYRKKKWQVLIGVLAIVVLSWMHKAILLLALIQLGWFFLARHGQRKKILGAIFLIIAFSLPGIQYLNGDGIRSEQAIQFRPGFLYRSTSWHEFSNYEFPALLQWGIYWVINWGLLPFTALSGWLAYVYSRRKELHTDKRWKTFWNYLSNDATVWLLGGVSVFVMANLVSFANDAATNHKLLNYTQFIFIILTAGLLAFWCKHRNFLVVPVFILVILGGVFDLMPIANDAKAHWNDFPKDEVARWIYLNTPADSVFLNTSYTTNSITTAGRKIYWGWDYFTSSIGYPLQQRSELIGPVLTGQVSRSESCRILQEANIDYIYLDRENTERFANVMVNKEYFLEHFDPLVAFPSFTIYDVELSCQTPLPEQ